jgi:hypothetical protein
MHHVVSRRARWLLLTGLFAVGGVLGRYQPAPAQISGLFCPTNSAAQIYYQGTTYSGFATTINSGLYYNTYSYLATNANGGQVWGTMRVSVISCLGNTGGWVQADYVTVDGASGGGSVDGGTIKRYTSSTISDPAESDPIVLE